MIYHVYSAYSPSNPDTKRRMDLARSTWSVQRWIDCPVPEEGQRMFCDSLGRVPFMKDILNTAAFGKSPNDILVFTNADICCSSDCVLTLSAALQGADAVYCYRRDFAHLNVPLPTPVIATGHDYCGSDLFAFRVWWWSEYGQDFPDMLLGREAWDAIMRTLMEMTNSERHCQMKNLIYHERHYSAWENPANRHSMPSQNYNLGLARTWLRSHNINPGIFGIP